jgi:hypothetical protein
MKSNGGSTIGGSYKEVPGSTTKYQFGGTHNKFNYCFLIQKSYMSNFTWLIGPVPDHVLWLNSTILSCQSNILAEHREMRE